MIQDYEWCLAVIKFWKKHRNCCMAVSINSRRMRSSRYHLHTFQEWSPRKRVGIRERWGPILGAQELGNPSVSSLVQVQRGRKSRQLMLAWSKSLLLSILGNGGAWGFKYLGLRCHDGWGCILGQDCPAKLNTLLQPLGSARPNRLSAHVWSNRKLGIARLSRLGFIDNM